MAGARTPPGTMARTMTDDSPFALRYAQAREKFLAAAQLAGAQLTCYEHPLPGRDGEALALDAAWLGPVGAQRLLIVSSACHGVEGFAGSGVQVAALRDAAWCALHPQQGVAVLYLHGLNPWGFSHRRRVTEDNIDLNRNFQDFTQPLPGNPAYAELHPLLLPDVWPPTADNQAALGRFMQQRGMAAVQAAVTGGQYQLADGLFYGGQAPCWSHRAFRQALRDHTGQARQIAWIDLHTGLGPSGHGERGYAGRADDAAAWQRACAWWGGDGRTPVRRLDDGSSVSAPLQGLLWSAIHDECPGRETTAMAIEFGTRPILQVLDALRGEQWLQLHPHAPPAQAEALKQALVDAFYIRTDDWCGTVLAQAREAMAQAVAGLAGSALAADGAMNGATSAGATPAPAR